MWGGLGSSRASGTRIQLPGQNRAVSPSCSAPHTLRAVRRPGRHRDHRATPCHPTPPHRLLCLTWNGDLRPAPSRHQGPHPIPQRTRSRPPSHLQSHTVESRNGWVGWDLKGHPFPSPCRGWGCRPLNQEPGEAALGPIQAECLQGWGTYSSSTPRPHPVPQLVLGSPIPSCAHTESCCSSPKLSPLPGCSSWGFRLEILLDTRGSALGPLSSTVCWCNF